MSKLVPKYTAWEAINTALALAARALDEVRNIARTPGPPGKDGADGVGFDDIDLVDTDAGFMLRFTRGDVVKDFRLPIIVDRGVFKEGQTYLLGDGVTWAGSFWIAQGETSEKPDMGKGWRLSVKRGRDGKDADPLKPKTKPVKG